MILDVPYYSQHFDVEAQQWRRKACGVASVKMVLDFLGASTSSLDEMIEQGASFGGYNSSGWSHVSLVKIAKSHEIVLHPVEFRKDSTLSAEELLDKGIVELVRSLCEGRPVIVSAIKNFSESKKFHLVVLVGISIKAGQLEGFYYHDSNAHEIAQGKNQFVSIERFKKHWRRMAIFVESS